MSKALTIHPNDIKITYLLGAGASVGVDSPKLPMVKGFADAVLNVRNEIEQDTQGGDFNQTPIAELKATLVRDLDDLYRQCKNHASVDTIARKYYLQRDNDSLWRLKSLVKVVLMYYQFTRGNDVRYDNLLASYLSGDYNTGISFPGNVRFLSWNYDIQLETSFVNLTNKPIEDFLIYNSEKQTHDFLPDNKGTLIKLNGSVSSINKGPEGIINQRMPRYFQGFCASGIEVEVEPEKVEKAKREIIRDSIIQHHSYGGGQRMFNGTPAIHYAWEGDEYAIKQRDFATSALKDTNILVVIGYSFPTFNRQIDRQILKRMSLQRIYIQDPYAESIRDRMNAVLPDFPIDWFRLSKDIGQFIVPDEW